MSYDDALRHHVERSLRRDLDLGRLVADEDGDYAVACSDAVVFVRPQLCDDPPVVRVWTMSAEGLKHTAALLREINELNSGFTGVRCFLHSGCVILSAEVEIESVLPGQLGRLVHSVGKQAAHIGDLVAAVHGGRRPFGREDAADDAERTT